MDSFDLLIVGGGINGAAIARDAAMRGAKVLLVEKDDLASHTSSASSKLVHGGLRYLEMAAIRLVRESLRERGILLRTAPHIVQPLRFVLPHCRGMRPHWMIRAGLFLYDAFALRGGLPRSRRVSRTDAELAGPLHDAGRLLSYWDAWVDDSRLTILNAVDAAERGAEVAVRTELLSARQEGGAWSATLSSGREVSAKSLVNAAGPWVEDLLARLGRPVSPSRLRLVKGSHIVVPRLWEGPHGYILQQPDRRVVFALPFQRDFTLIGTTDVPVAAPEEAAITEDETRYLCEAADRYFMRQVVPADVVWSYSGVRALRDDGAAEARAVSRDYHLELAREAHLLSVYGGKITTARALAEEALDRLGIDGPRRTSHVSLPGGELLPVWLDWIDSLRPWLGHENVARLASAYGTRLRDLIGNATRPDELGRHFGAGLYEAEVRYLVEKEFARTAEDILWRRTKVGLRMTEKERKAVENWLKG